MPYQWCCRALGSKEKATWHHSNFVGFSTSCQEDFDVILMSFALHHLPEPAKAGLLKQAQRLLSRRCSSRPYPCLYAVHEVQERSALVHIHRSFSIAVEHAPAFMHMLPCGGSERHLEAR